MSGSLGILPTVKRERNVLDRERYEAEINKAHSENTLAFDHLTRPFKTI